MLRRKRVKQMAEINVVPYIDVMLVLLVIFMITAPLLSQGVHVDLPQAAAQQLNTKNNEPIIVSIDATGNYYLNIAANPDVSMPPAELLNKVSAELQQSSAQGHERQVLVKGDKDVNYGRVVQAMVLLQNAGAPSVGLMTEPNEEQKSK